MKCRRPLLIAVCIVSLGGCVELSKPVPAQHFYRLDYAAAAAVGADPQPVVLRLAPVRVATLYDRDVMVYSEDRYGVGTYHYHRWSTPPGEMVGELLGRDLSASGVYRAVQQGPAAQLAEYQLEISIDRLEEENTGGGCSAALALGAQLEPLFGTPDSALLLRKSYEQRQSVACNDPRALAAALSTALQSISQQLQSDVAQAIQRHRAAR